MGKVNADYARGVEDGGSFWEWLAGKCEGPWAVVWVPISVVMVILAFVVLFLFGVVLVCWDCLCKLLGWAWAERPTSRPNSET
jgi:hypothetical protein